MRSKKQTEACAHNWIKARIMGARAAIYSALTEDKCLSMGARAHLNKADREIEKALELW